MGLGLGLGLGLASGLGLGLGLGLGFRVRVRVRANQLGERFTELVGLGLVGLDLLAVRVRVRAMLRVKAMLRLPWPGLVARGQVRGLRLGSGKGKG